MQIVQHPSGVWRAEADTLLALDVPESGIREQVWARKLSEGRYELCCIPFFAYDVALGDELRTIEFRVTEVVAKGRYVFRIWFEDAAKAPPILDRLSEAGCLSEARGRLAAIDVADEAKAVDVSGWLAEREAEGVLQYETGRRASS